MEKASGEMDMEEWEILSDDGLLSSNPKGSVDMNYYFSPSPPARHRLETPDNSSVPGGRNQLIPVPIHLEPMVEKNPDRELVKEIEQVPAVEINVASPVVLEKIKDLSWEGDQDTISQVFFKMMKENEFVDMKVDSPRSSGNGRGLNKPQIDLGAIQFEEEEEDDCKFEDFEHSKHSKEVIFEQEAGNKQVGPEMKGKGCWVGGGLNIWRWRVTGIGALCSMGVAAAGICIFIFGSHQRQKQQNQNQKLQFQIYAEDKRIKQVVHHASRLNQALSSVRGIPLVRAHITFGGHYDGPPLEHQTYSPNLFG